MEKNIDIHFEKKLDSLVKKIEEITDNDLPNSTEEETQKLKNTMNDIISTLLNDTSDFLAIIEKQDLEKLFNEFSNRNFWEVWENCSQLIYNLLDDLNGDFEFNKNTSPGQSEFKLNNSNLIIQRYHNRHKNLFLTLNNVYKVKITVTKEIIEVEAFDSFNKTIAFWDEYKKTTEVALVREDLNEYSYKWRKANK